MTLYPTLPSSTDGRQFYNTATTLGSVTVTNSTAAPGYLQTAIATMNAAYIFAELKAVQAGSPGALAAQLSADLVLRENQETPMAGTIITLMPRRHLDFSYLAGSGSEIRSQAAIPVAPFKSGLLRVRVHSANIGPSPARFLFRLYPTLPSGTDGRRFTNTVLAIAEVEVDASSPAAPTYLQDDFASNDAGYMLAQIHVEQATSLQTLAAQLSAALLLRED